MKISPARVPPKSTFTKSGVFADNIKSTSILLGSFGGRVVDAQHTSGLSAPLGKSPGRQHEQSVGSIGSLD